VSDSQDRFQVAEFLVDRVYRHPIQAAGHLAILRLGAGVWFSLADIFILARSLVTVDGFRRDLIELLCGKEVCNVRE